MKEMKEMKEMKAFLTKMLLTGAIAIGLAMPAVADTFPSNAYMLENKTYENAATYTNMGVYENSVNAVAEYEDIDYNLTAGKYLPQSSTTITDCPAGSYCTGVGVVHYSASAPQGITSCPSGYGNSATGSSANTQCYRACAIANNGTTFTNIAHATAVSGNDYYNTTATDTCEPTACDTGYSVQAGLNLATTIGTDQGTATAFINNSGSASGQTSTYGISDNNSWAVDYGNNKGT